MYSTYNEGKSVVADKFIKTLKNKISKHMKKKKKNVYFDVLDDIVNKYNNTIHRPIKMKPTEVTDDYYGKDPQIKPNKKDPKFKVSDNVRISNIKTFLLKNIFQIGQKKFL